MYPYTHTDPHPPNNPNTHAQSHLDGSPWKEQFEKKRAAMQHVLKEIMPPVLKKFEGKLGVDDVGMCVFWRFLGVLCVCCDGCFYFILFFYF